MVKPMSVLIIGEVSGVIRDAFNRKGHVATSCDINPQMTPGRHIHSDARNIINICDNDLIIAHPVCTYACNSGVKHLHYAPNRWLDMVEVCVFFKWIMELEVPRICIENPVMHKYAKRYIGVDQTQTIQPYNFGENASKRTCLWLKGLPKLENTNYVPPKIIEYRGKFVKRWGNQSPCGADSRGPSKTRGIDRSITYQGVADAMADQWG